MVVIAQLEPQLMRSGCQLREQEYYSDLLDTSALPSEFMKIPDAGDYRLSSVVYRREEHVGISSILIGVLRC